MDPLIPNPGRFVFRIIDSKGQTHSDNTHYETLAEAVRGLLERKTTVENPTTLLINHRDQTGQIHITYDYKYHPATGKLINTTQRVTQAPSSNTVSNILCLATIVLTLILLILVMTYMIKDIQRMLTP